MKPFSFSYQDTAPLADHEAQAFAKKVHTALRAIAHAVDDQAYATPYAAVRVPFDELALDTVQKKVALKKKLQPVCMVVIGIGGSNLGTKAVYKALFGVRGNPEFPLYFADTVDSDAMWALLAQVEHYLKVKKVVLLTLISKSGSTTESVANFECFLELLKKYHPKDYPHYVTVITDEHSPLWQLALEQHFDKLPIPKMVGGRYSVLSAVGLFPLACAGIDINALLQGARDIIVVCIKNDYETNSALQSAAIIAAYYARGFYIHDLFLFSTALEALGKWYRQLMAESIGKNVKVGITPTVSMGSADLHSVGQLYVAGPYDKLTTFVIVDNPNQSVTIPKMKEYETLVGHLQGKTMQQIMNAIWQGVQIAYQEHKRPFMSVHVPRKNAYYLGQFMQWKMIEIMILGALLDVNPFDQPQVELYKIQTRKILAHD